MARSFDTMHLIAHHSSGGSRQSTPVTDNQSFVFDLLDVMQVPPTYVDFEYMRKCIRSAEKLRNPIRSSMLAGGTSRLTELMLRSVAFDARNNVLDVVSRVGSYVSMVGRNVLFENPFSLIGQMNMSRIGFQSVSLSVVLADEIVKNISLILDAVESADNASDTVRRGSAQLSSARISFDGLGGSSSPNTDILQFSPEISAVRENKSKELLSVFDFERRVPKILFTANYAPDGEERGSLIGWKRIADASGYVVTRRNIFDGDVLQFRLSNAQLIESIGNFKDYVETYVLSFYDDIDLASIFVLYDSEIEPNAFYTYTVQGFRTRRSKKGSVFYVPVSPGVSSPAQRAELRRRMEILDPGAGPDTVSPYPILAQYFLGDSRFDWLLAGVNIRASVNRRDSREVTRSLSYLTAQMDFLFEQMQKNRFVVPKDVSDVVHAVNDGIVIFGVSQILEELLRETGVLYHFDGLDPREDSNFDRVPLVQDDSFLSTVLSAADPETATIDIRVLSTNIAQRLNRLNAGRTSEIEIPSRNFERRISHASEAQFAQSVEDNDFNADLTTFEGLGKFMRAIRLFSDLNSDRNVSSVLDQNNDTSKDKPSTDKIDVGSVLDSSLSQSDRPGTFTGRVPNIRNRK